MTRIECTIENLKSGYSGRYPGLQLGENTVQSRSTNPKIGALASLYVTFVRTFKVFSIERGPLSNDIVDLLI